MAMFKDFTFDGENSKDYGVYISGDAVYDAPERAMDMVQIPGRNGALALDNGYYNNIDVTYPAGCFADDQADFAAKLTRIRNMLASRHRYCRLEDAYHPDHFRMALYKSGLDVAPVARNKAGRFNIIFDAKPQRFLKSGEVVQELDADAPPTTSYGPADIVTFEGEPGDAIVHGQWPLEPIQDLHGYDSPWPAGGGKNKLPMILADIRAANTSGTWTGNSYAINGVTYTVVTDADGNVTAITASGTATANALLYLGEMPELTADMVLNGCPASGGNTRYRITYGAVVSDIGSGATIPTGSASARTYIRVAADYAISGTLTFYPMIRQSSEVDATFAPYSNSCPISGFTGAEITADGKNLFDPSKFSVAVTEQSGVFTFTLPGYNADLLIRVNGNHTYTPAEMEKLIALKAGTYVFSYKHVSGGVLSVRGVDANGECFVLNGTDIESDTYRAHRFTIDAPTLITILRVNNTNPSVFSEPQIELDTVRTAYAPFVGITYDITWQDETGTVYGGTLEYMGGDAWRLTKSMESVDMGTLPWGKSSTNTFQVLKSVIGMKNGDNAWFICSMYAKSGSSKDKSIFQTSNYVRVNDTAYTLVEDFVTAVTGQQLVYELATPVVYDLTGEALQALIGTNNMFSDTGTTTITVQSPYELENPTLYPSKPLIRVYGSGTIQVNDITITVAEHSGYIDIDCDIMDCHRGADSMNQYVSFSGNDFPELQPGINRILLSGPDKVEITPRWWEL